MRNQKGIIHLTLPLVLVVAIIAGVILIASGVIKIPSNLPFGKKTTSIELKTEYKNPFKKETQFVNPFNKYKNPFVVNR